MQGTAGTGDRDPSAEGTGSTGSAATAPVSRRGVLLRIAALAGAVSVGALLGREDEPRRPVTAVRSESPAEPPSEGPERAPRIADELPFASTSPWALPIVMDPDLEPEDGPLTSAFRDPEIRPWVNQGKYGHQIFYATSSDPWCRIEDRGDGNRWRGSKGYVPLDAIAAAGSDAHAHVVQPDGRTMLEMIGFRRESREVVSVSRVHRVDLLGDGLGPQNGVRAYGGSAVGGLIRAWEIDPSHPRYTGRIDHPIAWALSWSQLRSIRDERYDPWGYHVKGETDREGQPGHEPGNPRYTVRDGDQRPGFMRRVIQWPATEEDYTGIKDYSGAIPMATYVCIPADTPKPDDLAPATDMLWDAMVNYGGYITDTVGPDDSMPVYVEGGGPKWFRRELLGDDGDGQLGAVKAATRVVRTNDHENPNGGPLDAPRRLPLLPPPVAVPTA